MTTMVRDDHVRRRKNPLVRLLEYAASGHARAVAVLVVVALLAFLPGFFQIPPIDRDEARFSQASKQMVETGDYVDIRYQQETRYKKPIGIYWLQALTVKTGEALGIPRARTKVWLYRIPSLIGAIGAVLLTYWAALGFVTRRSAVLAGLMVASCILVGIEARLAKTDAMLLLTTVAAMGALGRVYIREREGLPRDFWLAAVFWTAVAGGALIKGPLILMFVGFPIVALSIADRNARWVMALRPGLGVLWFALLVLPWVIAMLMHSGTKFFTDAVGRDLLGKVATGQESHGFPPGFYLLLFWVTFWPGAVLTGLAALPIWRLRAEPGIRFLLAWIIPSWIVFELIVTKLPHYVLPTYPAIAILLALAVQRKILLETRWLKPGTIAWFLVPLLITLGCVYLVVQSGKTIGFWSWPVGIAAATFGLFAWWLYSRDEAEGSLLKGIAAAVLVAIAVHGIVLSTTTTLSASPEIARILRYAKCENPKLASAGFHEPSLVLLTNTDTLLTDGAGAAEFLSQGQCRFVSVEGRQLRNFLQRAEAKGLRYDAVKRFDSFNFGHGRKVNISVFRSRSEP